MLQNKALILAQPVTSWPEEGTHLLIAQDRTFNPAAAPPPGGLTTRNYYLSLDPYQRGRMRPATTKSYNTPYPPGQPITNSGIARVIQSGNERFKPGDVLLVPGALPVEEYSVLEKEVAERAKVLPADAVDGDVDVKLYLGALGMTGLTAFSSLYEIGRPRKGETIFISSAAGAVGQVVGQLAKHEGLRVIGSVGSEEKREWVVKELGFDAAFNYKEERPKAALERLAPEGIDIYYENVGGEHLEAAIGAMKTHGRIVVCGMISNYNTPPEQQYPIRNLVQIVPKRLTITGFLVYDPTMGPKYAKEHEEKLQQWIADGSFIAKTHVTVGIDNAAKGFLGMLKGENFGKAVLQIRDLKEDED